MPYRTAKSAPVAEGLRPKTQPQRDAHPGTSASQPAPCTPIAGAACPPPSRLAQSQAAVVGREQGELKNMSRAVRSGRRSARRPRHLRLITLAILVMAALSATAVVAYGEIVGTPNKGHLTAFGPIDGTTGFPSWYKDETGLRLEPCIDANNSLCGFVPGDVPDPNAPLSIPDNF